MIWKGVSLPRAVFSVGVFVGLAFGQVSPPTVLVIDIENFVEY